MDIHRILTFFNECYIQKGLILRYLRIYIYIYMCVCKMLIIQEGSHLKEFIFITGRPFSLHSEQNRENNFEFLLKVFISFGFIHGTMTKFFFLSQQ